ncbi:MAG: T9SS type A sorting domain-containing protein [Bacteroidales bacterium]|nr:T9SS type A sorting domain-containing protein [Bacteroidales bacterium]
MGNSVTLNPAPSSNGTVSYRWNNGSTSSTLLASSAGTYSVTVTSTIGTCSTTRSSSATITVNTPNIENVSSYDYIWKGNTANWNTASNWYVYNNGYSVASSVPTIDKNIYIGSSQCVGSSWPTANSTANAKDITIASGATLTIPASKTLNIAGNITNNGTLTANNSSTIVFKGNNDQILSGTMIFGNVTFNQAGVHKIIASSGITVNNIANFTKGIVVGDMTFYAGATASNVTDSASFVDGKVTKRTGASVETDFIFPTGSATDGQPKVLGSVLVASLSANSETSIVFNQKSNGGGFSDSELPQFWKPNNCNDNNPLFNHISNFEFWKVNTTSNLTATLKVSADNQNAHFNTGATTFDNDDIYGAIWQGGCWKNVGGSAVISEDKKTITITNVTIPEVSIRAGEPSWLTMGSKEHETWLPIELVSFTANCNGRSALIEWTTATEKNNDFFVLERSHDAVNFKEIARIAGAGNSIETLNYVYTDYGARSGDNYYRLVQVDYDGTSTASEIIVANCLGTDGEPEVLAYPNPFGDDLTLRFENFGNIQATVEVYDMLGRMVHTQKVNCSQNDYEVVLRLAGLSDGTYNVRISAKEFVLNRQVIKN